MTQRFGYILVFLFLSAVGVSACTTAEPATPTGSASSGSSSGTAGMGGAGGSGGLGGGGIVMEDDFLCTALGLAGTHEPLVAGVDETSASLLAAPDTIYDVTIPQNGGFVALELSMMHTTFVVYASDTEAFEVLLDGTPVVESVEPVTCKGLKFHRFQHHSHDPSKFVVALPPAPANQSVVFYHLL